MFVAPIVKNKKIILDKSKDTTYSSFDRSRIFLSTADFENFNKKTTKKY